MDRTHSLIAAAVAFAIVSGIGYALVANWQGYDDHPIWAKIEAMGVTIEDRTKIERLLEAGVPEKSILDLVELAADLPPPVWEAPPAPNWEELGRQAARDREAFMRGLRGEADAAQEGGAQ